MESYPKPFLLLLSGPPGAGKTTLREKLIHSGKLKLTVLDGDDIVDSIFGSSREDNFRQEVEPKIIEALLALARTNLKSGNDVVIDSPWTIFFNRHPQVIQQVQDVVNQSDAQLLIVQLRPTEFNLRAQITQRHAERDRPKIADEQAWQAFLANDYVNAENPLEKINNGLKEKAKQIVIHGNDGSTSKGELDQQDLDRLIEFLNSCIGQIALCNKKY